MWHTGSKTIFGINVEQTISQFWSENFFIADRVFQLNAGLD